MVVCIIGVSCGLADAGTGYRAFAQPAKLIVGIAGLLPVPCCLRGQLPPPIVRVAGGLGIGERGRIAHSRRG